MKKKSLQKTVGHNSEPTQKQNYYCESIKSLIKNQKQKYNPNAKVEQRYSFKEKQIDKSWTQ